MQLQYLKRNVFECHGFCLMSSLFANLPYIQGENMKQTLRMRNILCPVFLDLIIPHKSVCNSSTSSVDLHCFSAKSDHSTTLASIVIGWLCARLERTCCRYPVIFWIPLENVALSIICKPRIVTLMFLRYGAIHKWRLQKKGDSDLKDKWKDLIFQNVQISVHSSFR